MADPNNSTASSQQYIGDKRKTRWGGARAGSGRKKKAVIQRLYPLPFVFHTINHHQHPPLDLCSAEPFDHIHPSR
jgi:hypothetical protein